MKTFLLGIGGGFIGTFIALGSIILLINIRYFLFASHFCPVCGNTKHRDEWIHWDHKMAKCCRCNKVFSPSSDDYRRYYPRVNGDQGMSIRLPKDWGECITVFFRWKMKKLKERFPRVPNLKASENKT